MIIMDYREAQSSEEIFKALGEPPTSELPCDYLLHYPHIQVGIERKTASGLLGDLETGRFQEQMRSLDTPVRILLIEGLILPARNGKTLIQKQAYKFDYYDLKGHFEEGARLQLDFRKARWNFTSVMNLLLSACLSLVHHLEFTLSPAFTAKRIEEFGRYFAKESHNSFLAQPMPFSFHPEERLWPPKGVGQDRERRLLKHFGSLKAICEAEVEELCRVEGIGRKTAEEIYKAVRKKI